MVLPIEILSPRMLLCPMEPLSCVISDGLLFAIKDVKLIVALLIMLLQKYCKALSMICPSIFGVLVCLPMNF